VPSEEISVRALNRATLARQLLLERAKIPIVEGVERIAGLQAQLARPPYIGLWSRLVGFDRESLNKLLLDRQIVRATMMRGTIHLVSRADFVSLRPAMQPALNLALTSILRSRKREVDLDRVVREAKKFFARSPATFDALRDHLLEAFPGEDERAMGYAVRMQLPLVQVPTDARWGFPGAADFALAEEWLDAPIASTAPASRLALRYLAAFGPATPADFQTWSGLSGGKEIFSSIEKKLRRFRCGKRELFDLPDAPRPGEETEAPVRFLPDYDNVLLAHAVRDRIIAEEHRSRIATKNLLIPATFLVDGFVAGMWKIERKKRVTTLTLDPFIRLSAAVRKQLLAEGGALCLFLEEEPGERKVEIG
jgi:hypothetical protein